MNDLNRFTKERQRMRALVEKDDRFIPASPEIDAGKVRSIITDQTLQFALIFSLFIFIPLCQFTFRFADDNRLLSWSWGFSWEQLLLLLGTLAVALLVIAFIARIDIVQQKNSYLLPMLALIAVAPFWQQPEIIIDNSRYFTQAKFLELYGPTYFLQHWGRGIFAWTDLPLVPFIYGLVFQLFGEHRYIIQLVNALFYSGAVLMTYMLGKNLWSHEHGVLGALLLMGIPYLYNQVPLMLVDIPAMFFLTAALLTSLLAVSRGGASRVVLAACVIVMAMLSKYSTWLMLSVIPMLLVLARSKSGSTTALVVGVIFKRLLAIAMVVLVMAAIVLSWNYQVFQQQIQLLFQYQWNGLSRWHESHTSSFLFQVYPLISVLAVVALVVAYKKKDYRILVVAWLPLLLIALEVKRMRYLVPMLPMLALLAAYSLTEIKDAVYKRFIAYGTVVSAFLIAMMMNTGFVQQTSSVNIKLAGEYLNKSRYPVVETVVLPQYDSMVNPVIAVPALDYHTNKTVVYKRDQQLSNDHKPANANTSSVRFTWEYPLPAYYANEIAIQDKKLLAIIYSHSDQLASQQLQQQLQNYRLTKTFTTTDRVFKYQTLVNIYEPI